eukprot:3178722-Amphidinium_carterae.2
MSLGAWMVLAGRTSCLKEDSLRSCLSRHESAGNGSTAVRSRQCQPMSPVDEGSPTASLFRGATQSGPTSTLRPTVPCLALMHAP